MTLAVKASTSAHWGTGFKSWLSDNGHWKLSVLRLPYQTPDLPGYPTTHPTLQATQPHTRPSRLPYQTPDLPGYPTRHPTLQATLPDTRPSRLPNHTPDPPGYPIRHPTFQATLPHSRPSRLPYQTPDLPGYPTRHPTFQATLPHSRPSRLPYQTPDPPGYPTRHPTFQATLPHSRPSRLPYQTPDLPGYPTRHPTFQATLPHTRPSRVRAGTGWPRVSTRRLGKIKSLQLSSVIRYYLPIHLCQQEEDGGWGGGGGGHTNLLFGRFVHETHFYLTGTWSIQEPSWNAVFVRHITWSILLLAFPSFFHSSQLVHLLPVGILITCCFYSALQLFRATCTHSLIAQ